MANLTKQELETKLVELRRIERIKCNEATKDLKKEISEVASSISDYDRRKRISDRQAYLEIANLVADMARMSFLRFQFGGYDDRFEVKHHVNWISVRQEGTDFGEWENDHVSYASKWDRKEESPDVASVRKFHLKMKKIFDEVMNEVERME